MTEPMFNCPRCNVEIKLTESLVASLTQTEQNEYESRLMEREKVLRDQYTEKLAQESKRVELAAEFDLSIASKKATGLQEIIVSQNRKLIEAQTAQTDALKKQQELDDAKREVALDVTKRVLASTSEIREEAKKELESDYSLRIKEKDEVIASMNRRIEGLNVGQKSQQLQGEAMELVLEDLLRSKFPQDGIEPVQKGDFGGDVIHHVFSPNGVNCGTILWEAKRTKNWSDGWLTKLRGDTRTAEADVPILVSKILPKDIENIGQMNGVWVCTPQFILPAVMFIRHMLIMVSNSKQIQLGQKTKSEMIYQYFTGPQFRRRIEVVAEAFSTMQEDLNKERKAITKQWAKREQQLRHVIDATSGMSGELQGIVGQEVEESDVFELESQNVK